jgi:hypothetical protein
MMPKRIQLMSNGSQPTRYRTAVYNRAGRRVQVGITNNSLKTIRSARSSAKVAAPHVDLRIEALIDGEWELYDL